MTEREALVRRAIHAYNHGDLEQLRATLHGECAWDLSTWGSAWPGTEVHEGHEGVLEFMREWRSIFGQDTVVEIEEVHESGDRIAVIGLQSGRGRGSAQRLQLRWGQVYSFRDGLIERIENHSDPERALETIGVKPRGTS